MEFEFDAKEGVEVWAGVTILLVIVLLFGLGAIGKPVTPYLSDGTARVMTWQDWHIIKAEKAYVIEIESLRGDADALIATLDANPDPVRTQLLVDEILRNTSDGVDALGMARLALAEAALSVRDWSTGILDRDSAVAALQIAVTLLK